MFRGKAAFQDHVCEWCWKGAKDSPSAVSVIASSLTARRRASTGQHSLRSLDNLTVLLLSHNSDPHFLTLSSYCLMVEKGIIPAGHSLGVWFEHGPVRALKYCTLDKSSVLSHLLAALVPIIKRHRQPVKAWSELKALDKIGTT